MDKFDAWIRQTIAEFQPLNSISTGGTALTKKSRNSTPSIGQHLPTVFVVEDDEAARHSVAALLESMGYAIRTFGSCEEFLGNAEEARGNLLLLDYRFDGLSGLQLLDRLRNDRIFIPTILFTGVFDASIKRRARNYREVVSVLDKPVSSHSLRHALRNAATLLRSHGNGTPS